MSRQSAAVTDIIIGVAQQMLDDKRKPELLDLRSKWGCDELTQDHARAIVQRVKDAADNDVSLCLTTDETRTLFTYMLNVETTYELRILAARRITP